MNAPTFHPPVPGFRALWASLPLLLACALLLSSAFGQEGPATPAAPAVGDEEGGETVFSLVLKGGWLMVPIAICSVVALMYAIERAISLRRLRTAPDGLLEDLFAVLPAIRPDWEEQERAAEFLDESRSILGDTLRAGVLKIHRGRQLAESFLSEAAAKQVHLLKRKLRPFAVVASLAPLLGLLGTIYGMITCFENAASTDAASRTESLARGIYAALVTTAAGLSVAIPSMVLFHYFEGKVDRVVDEIEESLSEFLEHYFDSRPLEESPRPRAAAPARRKA